MLSSVGSPSPLGIWGSAKPYGSLELPQWDCGFHFNTILLQPLETLAKTMSSFGALVQLCSRSACLFPVGVQQSLT